ncbi:MAG: hypothetical protein RR313_00215 [Anaerovoracaceae bacterium]
MCAEEISLKMSAEQLLTEYQSGKLLREIKKEYNLAPEDLTCILKSGPQNTKSVVGCSQAKILMILEMHSRGLNMKEIAQLLNICYVSVTGYFRLLKSQGYQIPDVLYCASEYELERGLPPTLERKDDSEITDVEDVAALRERLRLAYGCSLEEAEIIVTMKRNNATYNSIKNRIGKSIGWTAGVVQKMRKSGVKL